MQKEELIEHLLEEGLPPNGWKYVIIKIGEDEYDYALITCNSTLKLGANEEIVLEIPGDVRNNTPYFPEWYLPENSKDEEEAMEFAEKALLLTILEEELGP